MSCKHHIICTVLLHSHLQTKVAVYTKIVFHERFHANIKQNKHNQYRDGRQHHKCLMIFVCCCQGHEWAWILLNYSAITTVKLNVKSKHFQYFHKRIADKKQVLHSSCGICWLLEYRNIPVAGEYVNLTFIM